MGKPKFARTVEDIELPKHAPLVTEIYVPFESSYPYCEVCGEEILPQYSASSWLGDFHQGCFYDVMRLAPVPKILKALMATCISIGITRARKEA